MPAERIVFQTNVSVELALRFIEGKPVESKFGTGMQHMFSCTDGRVFYLAEAAGDAVSAQLRELGAQPGEFVTITKAEVDAGRGRKQIRWIVTAAPAAADTPPPPPALAPPALASPIRRMPPQPATPAWDELQGERPDGTYGAKANSVPALKPAPKPAAVPAQAHPAAKTEVPEWAQVLLASTNVIVDVYASAVKHAAKHEGLVKPETVQSILVTALINLSKNSTLAVGK